VQYLKNLLKKIVVGWVEMSDAMGINLPLPLFDGNLKNIRTQGGQTFGGTTGYPLHAETWQLVEHGGDRTQRPEKTVP
jgi:hypothetical protein